MYGDLPKEMQEHIKRLGLWGRSKEEIMQAAFYACEDIIDQNILDKKLIQELKTNQMELIMKILY